MKSLQRAQATQVLCCFGSPVVLIVLAISGCSQLDLLKERVEAGLSAPPSIRASFDFRKGSLGWEADFSDYAISQADMQFESGLRPLPRELNTDVTGFYIHGNNRHHDLFMFLKRRLGPGDGIRKKQDYVVTFKLLVASNISGSCLDMHGTPGEEVYLKVGASSTMPVAIPKNGTYRMNMDKGEQRTGGKDASLVGSIANGLRCKDFSSRYHVPYVSLEQLHRHPFPAKASSTGELWLLVGIDSGFESLTGPYYQQIDVELTPVTGDALPTGSPK